MSQTQITILYFILKIVEFSNSSDTMTIFQLCLRDMNYVLPFYNCHKLKTSQITFCEHQIAYITRTYGLEKEKSYVVNLNALFYFLLILSQCR